MGEFNNAAWIDATKRYVEARRRCWLFNLASIGVVGLFAMIFSVAVATRSDALAGTAFLLIIPVYLGLGIPTIISSYDVKAFRCPRCGKRFISNRIPWLNNTCAHCELDLDDVLEGQEGTSGMRLGIDLLADGVKSVLQHPSAWVDFDRGVRNTPGSMSTWLPRTRCGRLTT